MGEVTLQLPALENVLEAPVPAAEGTGRADHEAILCLGVRAGPLGQEYTQKEFRS